MVYLKANAKSLVFLPVTSIWFIILYGMAKEVRSGSNAVLEEIEKKNLYALQYSTAEGAPTMDYPANPNGSFIPLRTL